LLLQGILLSPLSENVLGGALGADVLNLGGLVGLTVSSEVNSKLFLSLLPQGILLTPLSENVLGGALGADVLNLGQWA
jgi:uncharacterized membrane protein